MIDIFELFSNSEELPDYRYYYTPRLFALPQTTRNDWAYFALNQFNPDVIIPYAIY